MCDAYSLQVVSFGVRGDPGNVLNGEGNRAAEGFNQAGQMHASLQLNANCD